MNHFKFIGLDNFWPLRHSEGKTSLGQGE